MTPFQLCFGFLCFLTAFVLISRIARGGLRFWKGSLWAYLWVLGGVLILCPQLTTVVASCLGIGRGTDLVLYLGAIMGVYAFQYLFKCSRRLENAVTEMVRRHAIDTAAFPKPERMQKPRLDNGTRV